MNKVKVEEDSLILLLANDIFLNQLLVNWLKSRERKRSSLEWSHNSKYQWSSMDDKIAPFSYSKEKRETKKRKDNTEGDILTYNIISTFDKHCVTNKTRK